MLLYRLAPEGFYAAGDSPSRLRWLYSDPFEVPAAQWELGRPLQESDLRLLAPVNPGKIVGIGRNYREHAAELDNPMPTEPLIFLKAPSAVIGPGAPILIPPQSQRVDFEGEVAVVIGRTASRADRRRAEEAILGVTAACDVTARDLQREDRTFARAKSFDTFCPLGPGVWVGADLEALAVRTRVNGEERQAGRVEEMTWGPVELVRFVSEIMTLEPGDVLLTGTPAGVGPLRPGDVVQVDVTGAGVLENPVEARRP